MRINRLSRTLALFAAFAAGCFSHNANAAAEEPSAATPVCFYEHVNFAGASLCTSESQSWIGNSWNDRISSVKIASGYSLKLYEHAALGGRSIWLQGDVDNLTQFQFNDSASSLAIEAKPIAEPCVTNVPFKEGAVPSSTPVDAKFCHMRGLWVWNTRDVLPEGLQNQEFVRTVRDLGVTDVFLYLTAGDYTASRGALRILVSDLKAAGISSWGLDGSRGYFSDVEGPTRLYASVDALVTYNKSVLPQEQFAGFQSDMEPQDQGGFPSTFHNGIRDDQLNSSAGGVWRSSQALDREMLLRDWLAIHNTCRNKLTAAGLKFSAAMPFWTEDYYGAPVMVSYGGTRETVGQQMMKIVHDYVIMSYNTNPDNAASRVAAQARMASELPFEKRPRISGAVETHLGVDVNVSYADTPGKNSRRVVLEDIDHILSTLGSHRAFGGFSVHDWEGWRTLPH
ncbi:MAG TPA: peptidase inhibitor family I36 protein [Telluria sp.]|jgi:hypothetical protein